MKKLIFILILNQTVLLSQWQLVNHYWDIPLFAGVDIVDSNTIYVSGVRYVLKSNNGGANWFSVFSCAQCLFENVLFININTGFINITTGNNLPFQMYKTTNAGLNWFGVGMSGSQAKRIDMVDSLYGYASAFSEVFKTTNGGVNWIMYEPGGGLRDGFGIDFINRDTGYYGVRSHDLRAYIYKTTNGGVNWIYYNMHTPMYITGISMCDAYTGYAVSQGTIYKTINGSFDPFDVQYFFNVGSSMWDIQAINPDTVYIASWQGVIKTTNGGDNWYIYPTGNNFISSIDMLNSTTGYAVGSDKLTSTIAVIYKTTNGGYVIGIEPYINTIPNYFSLSQIYPNPFNSSTLIKFQLPKHTYIKLIIFDIQGKIAEILADNYLDAGKYYINWNPEKFSSGIYFCKMITNEYNDTKKMILIK